MSARVAFLFGAGASVPAGLPLLKDLTMEVGRRLTGRIAALYDALCAAPPAVSRGYPNIERILATLESMRLSRISPHGFSLRDVAILEQEARKQIWWILQEHPKTEYLSPLSSVIDTFRPLDIFTLNNDLVVEEWTEKRGVSLTRGFSASRSWDARCFDDPLVDVRLFKLHGSVDWSHKPGWPLVAVDPRGLIRKPDGTAVRRSLIPEVNLVFPSQNKIITESSLLDLHWRFRATLRQLDLLVVVGCSLGDAHIAGAILDGLAEARSLRVLVVDPSIRPLGQLLPHKGPPIASRVEFLPATFDEALKGSLLTAIHETLCGTASIARCFYQALRQPSSETFDALADDIERRQPLSELERQSLDVLLRPFVPTQAISGGFFVFIEELRNALASTDSRHLIHALRSYGRFGAAGANVAAGIDFVDGHVYFIGSGGRVHRRDAAGAETLVGGSVRDPFGIAVIDEFAYVIERNVLRRARIEGIGAVRRVSLRDGKQSLRFRPRPSPVRWSELKDLLVTGREVAAGSAAKRDLFRKMTEQIGMLNYPTSVRRFPPGGLVLVESRQATIVVIDSWTAVATTPPEFLNLGDCAVLDENRILLLEGGAQGEGRILLWRVKERSFETLLDNIAGVQGIAVHPALAYMLLAYGAAIPDGAVERRDLSGAEVLVAGPGRIVASGLHRPKYLAHVRDDEWCLSSGEGVLRFSC